VSGTAPGRFAEVLNVWLQASVYKAQKYSPTKPPASAVTDDAELEPGRLE
jgi:hypothetical protein